MSNLISSRGGGAKKTSINLWRNPIFFHMLDYGIESIFSLCVNVSTRELSQKKGTINVKLSRSF
jgi:hypothetical protein